MDDSDRASLEAPRTRDTQGFHAGLVLDGRYRLERLLAEGGMGSVWVGHQITLEREVAVKLLRVGSEQLRARLRREALALAAVHHPAVVAVHDYGETAERVPYLVMELVRGETLGARVFRAGPLPAPEAVALVLPLLEGLAVAHRAGVVHRDIKPDNVVLSIGPGGVTPKLLDFGIARLERAEGARITADGGFIGTPAYMAPEQVRGAVADERSDVWGMAALLYELVAGASPFGTEDVIAVIRRVLDEPPAYPRDARGVDGKLWSTLMAALRKDPAQRTPSAAALRDALAGWLEERGHGPLSMSSLRALSPLPPVPSPAARVAATLVAEAPPPAPPPRVIDAAADTAPESVPDDAPVSLDALIRSRLGQS